MTRADFSTRIDVQLPNPALLPVIGDAVSERFADGVSNYRNQLERSLSQSSSTATARQTDRIQPPSGRQQQVSSAAASATSSARVTVNSRRSGSQPRRRQPTSHTIAEPAPRLAPVSDRSFLPTSRTGPADDNSPAPDVSTDETHAIETAPAETATQRTASTEAAPVEGTPPVDLQLFTIAEVTAESLLAGSGPSGKDGLSGSSSQSGEGPEAETALEPADHPGNEILIPPAGIFVVPNPADATTNSSGEADATIDEAGQGETLPDGSQTNSPSVTVGDSQSGRVEPATDAQVSQQLSSTPNPAVTPTRQVQAAAPVQLLTASGSGPDEASSVDSVSNQATGTTIADFRAVGPTDVAADGNGTTIPDDTSTAAGRSAGSSSTVVDLGEGADSTIRRHGDDSSAAEPQTTGTASAETDNQSGPTPRTGQTNPAVASVSSPLVSETLSAAKAETSVSGSQSIDVDGSTTGGRNTPAVASGAVTTSPREIGSAQTTNGPQGGQTAELVDRVAAAVRSAHQSQRELRIRLTPPELGTVRIEISSRGGTLTARLDVETAAAQQAIQQNLSLLRDALAQHGTNVERIDIQLAPNRNEEGRPQSGGQHQPDPQQQGRQEQRQPRHGSQEPQRSEDEERPGPSNSFRSLDELDIQV